MPPAAAALVGAVAVGVSTGAAVGAFLGISAIAGGILAGAVSFGLSMLTQVLAPKPSLPNLSSFEQQATARTSFLRQPITARRLPFGSVILSGPLTFYEATGGNRFHHMVITLGDAPHPWAGIDLVWLDDTPVFPHQIGADGMVTAGKFSGRVRIKRHLGGADQAADEHLVAAISRLDSNFRGRGVAYLYIRVEWDRDRFPNGLPRPRALCRTNTVLDARDQVRRFTPNTALALHEYLTLAAPDAPAGTGPGLEYDADDVSEAHTVAAANLCDEIVDARAVGHAVVAVDVAADALDLAVAGDGAPLRFETGDRIELFAADGGALPGGIAVETDYYAIVDRLVGAGFGGGTTIALNAAAFDGAAAAAIAAGDIDATHGAGTHARIRLAASYEDALEGIAIDITSAGSGQLVVVKTGEPRYACAGVIESDREPKAVIDDMRSAMGGGLVWTGGQFRILAGGFVTPTGPVLDEGDLMGPLVVRTRHSRRERFNAVRGIFATHLTVGEPTDYPPVIDTAFVAADGGRRVWADLDMPWIGRSSMAQRVAKRALSRHRREITVEYPTTLKGLLWVPGSTLRLNNARRGWNEKVFEVVDLVDEQYPVEPGPDGQERPPLQGVRLFLAETDATVDAFDPDSDETVKPPKAIPPGGSPLTAAAPSGLQLSSGTAELDVRLDGTVFSRIRLSWEAPEDAFVTGGGFIETRYKKSAAATWRQGPTVPGGETEAWILDVEDGAAYDAAIRSVNQVGVHSDLDEDPAAWQALVEGHVVLGKTEPPPDPDSLAAFQNAANVLFKIRGPRFADFDHYDLRFAPRGAGLAFDDMTPVDEETLRTEMTTASVPPGDWTFAVKSVDTSGNFSDGAATANLVVFNAFDVILEEEQRPGWTGLGAGSSAGFARNPLTGNLNVRSQDGDSTADDVFERYVPRPVATAVYEAPEIDIGLDIQARIWGTIDSNLGPLETGIANPQLEVDHRTEAGAFEGFQPWSIGALIVRHVKARLVMETADGLARITGFRPTIDVEEREEIFTGVAVASGGTAVAFAQPFFREVNVEVTNAEDSARFVAAIEITLSGFTVKVWDAAGAPTAGTVNARAIGV